MLRGASPSAGGASPFTMFPESTVAAEGDSIHRSLVKACSKLHDAATGLGVANTTTLQVSASAPQGVQLRELHRLLYEIAVARGLV